MKKEINDLNILFICGSYPPIACGVGDYTYNLANSMFGKVNKISVLCSCEASADNENSDVEVLNLVDKWTGIKLIRTVFSLLKRTEFDIIHIQYPSSKYQKGIINNILPLILRIKGKKVVYTLHEYSKTSLLYKLSKVPAIVFSNKIIVVDREFKDEIGKTFPLCRKKLEFVHIASNIPKSTCNSEETDALRKDILSFNRAADRIISYFGFITPNKCMELVLKSLKNMNDTGRLNSIFMIIGKFNLEDEYQARIYKLIEEYGLSGHVYITEYLEPSQVGKYLAASDAALLLYDNGVSPRNGAFLAAQQENIAVFTTESQKIKPFIKETENVYLVENKIESIENAIIAVQQGKELKRLSCRLFDWETVVEKHIDIYNSLISVN